MERPGNEIEDLSSRLHPRPEPGFLSAKQQEHMKPLRIGLIGYGFMGRAHSNAFRKVGNFFDLKHQPVLQAVCARDAEKAKSFASKWGYASIETDWRKLVEREDIDLIDIASPNNTHAEIAMAAAKAGKMILCEKPLAMNGPQGEKMVAAIQKAKVPNMVWYNYRRIPAVTLAKQLIDEGRLGRIFHYRAKFLQDWTISPELPQGGAGLWRLDVKVAGSGVTGRSAGPLYRHRSLAEWRHRHGDGHDGDLREATQAQSDGQGRKGGH
jgi:predicted dehydrogenase